MLGSISMQWAKEAVNISTSMLSEQQKISVLSEYLTMLTFQPQEQAAEELNFKEQLTQLIDQITFEVEQKELAILSAPTRLEDKRAAVEKIYMRYRRDLEQVETAFAEPQLDRGTDKYSALGCFNEGYDRFIEQN